MECIIIGLFFSGLLKAQDTTQVKKKRTYTIYITSEPENASVFIDDSLHGKTPLILKDYPKKAFSLRLADEKKRSWFMNIGPIQNEEFSVHAFIFKDYGQVQLFSEPSGADIYLNDSLIGKTPLGPVNVPIGINKIKLIKGEEFRWENELTVYKMNSHLHTINAHLHSRYSQLKINSLRKEYDVNFDGASLSADQRSKFGKIRSGQHYLIVNRELEKSNLELDFSTDPDTTYILLEKLNQFTTRPFRYSLIVPGLGQFLKGAKAEGIGIFAGFMGTGLATFLSIKNYSDKSDNFETQRLKYLSSRDEIEALKNKEIMVSTKKEMDNAGNVKQIAIGLFAGVYLYNLVDALLFHSREDYLEVIKSDSIIDFTSSFKNPGGDMSLNFKISL